MLGEGISGIISLIPLCLYFISSNNNVIGIIFFSFAAVVSFLGTIFQLSLRAVPYSKRKMEKFKLEKNAKEKGGSFELEKFKLLGEYRDGCGANVVKSSKDLYEEDVGVGLLKERPEGFLLFLKGKRKKRKEGKDVGNILVFVYMYSTYFLSFRLYSKRKYGDVFFFYLFSQHFNFC
jgi:hypothetical protein